MNILQEYEKTGLYDLFKNNQEVLLNVSKSLIKNIMNKNITSAFDALNILFLHGDGTTTILNKKLITKEILFQYLHDSNVPIAKNSTKMNLIEKVKEYWIIKFKNVYENPPHIMPHAEHFYNYNYPEEPIQRPQSTNNNYNHPEEPIQRPQSTLIQNNFYMVSNNDTDSKYPESFPINKLAVQFAEWFFKRLNKQEIKTDDFWSDIEFSVKIYDIEAGSIENIQRGNCNQAVEELFKITGPGISFNPNITHKGCQGRINQYGLVLVLSCGTLHKVNNFIGVFESTFGLARDLTAENNWKVKVIKMFLKNANTTVPELQTSESLQNALSLPETNCSLN